MLEEISDLSHACLSLSLLPTCEPMLSLVLAYIGLALHVQCCLLGKVSNFKIALSLVKKREMKVRPYRLVIVSLT